MPLVRKLVRVLEFSGPCAMPYTRVTLGGVSHQAVYSRVDSMEICAQAALDARYHVRVLEAHVRHCLPDRHVSIKSTEAALAYLDNAMAALTSEYGDKHVQTPGQD